MKDKIAYRGSIFYFKDTATLANLPTTKDPQSERDRQYVYIEDGVLIVQGGRVVEAGSYADLKAKIAGLKLVNYKNKIITPGFIDTHQHATQSGAVAAYGEKLLEWLDNYVFPCEVTYKDDNSARKDLNYFLDELLRNGTTTAVSYGPSYYEATNIFFEELERRNMRFITGNILMDCNGPDNLILPTQECYDISKKLLDQWHDRGRLSYCITPRFALSCSEKLMELCGALKKSHPDCYVQTHLDENLAEIAEVKRLFPKRKNYLDVYDHFGLATDRTVFGHCIHMTDAELQRLGACGGIIAWCPLSNNFLGSGLFNVERAMKYTDKITLGSDLGGGNCLSMFAVMDDAYKVSMLNSIKLPSLYRWFFATLGAAKALHLDDKIGSFKSGKEADFIVIDPEATSDLRYRREKVSDIFELLFIIMTLGSADNIAATYVYGEPLYIKGEMKERKGLKVDI